MDEFKMLVRDLNSADIQTRSNAAKRLGELQDANAVPFLVKALNDYSGNSGRSAPIFHALFEFGDLGVMALIKVLKNKRSDERELQIRAAVAIGEIAIKNPESEKVIESVPFLSRALYSWIPALRACAAEALRKIISAYESAEAVLEFENILEEKLGNPNEQKKEMNPKRLSVHADKANSTDVLIKKVRTGIERKKSAFKERDDMIKALSGSNPEVRVEATRQLLRLIRQHWTFRGLKELEIRLQEEYDGLCKTRNSQIHSTVLIAELKMKIAQRKNSLASQRDLLLDDIPKPPKEGGMYNTLDSRPETMRPTNRPQASEVLRDFRTLSGSAKVMRNG